MHSRNRARAAVLASGALLMAGCSGDSPAISLDLVAHFAPGSDSSATRAFVLEPRRTGPAPSVLPEPGTPAVPPSPGEPTLHTSPMPTLPLVEPPVLGHSIAWVNGGEHLAVITYGSSSCPAGPHALEVADDQLLRIELGPLFPDREVCSADLSPHASVVEIPAGIRSDEPLTARFGEHEYTLSPLADD